MGSRRPSTTLVTIAARLVAWKVRLRVQISCLKPQFGHNIGLQAPISTQPAWVLSGA